jgi:MOSC domain-containing protein YiiM
VEFSFQKSIELPIKAASTDARYRTNFSGTMTGVLIAIHISPTAGTLPHAVEHVRVLAGRGIEGDRYGFGCGTFSPNAGQRDVTLIEEEALAQFSHEYQCSLDAAESRRNLLTRGVRLNDLVGREFLVGSIPMRGLRLCEPCTHLARLTSAPVLPGLVHRGGLYAEILKDGELRAGDPISVTM